MVVIGVILCIVGVWAFLALCETLKNYQGQEKSQEVKKDIKNFTTTSIVCVLGAIVCFVAGPLIKIIILLALLVVAIFGFFNSLEREKQQKVQKQLEEEREKARKEKEAEERKRMKQQIIQFAKRNGVDMEYLYQQRDMYYNQAIRDLFVSKMAKPIEPTYQRGVVRGSLGDNIATIANAQKKADYEKAMAQNEKTAQSARLEFSDYIRYAEKIIFELKQMPDSQQYVEYEEKEYKETMEQIRNL